MASPRFDGSPEPQSLEVHRLESAEAGDSESVVMVKLTDEMFTALLRAQKKNYPISVRVSQQGGVWELNDGQGGSNSFQFQKQSLPYSVDAVVVDSRSGTHTAVGSFQTKYQIQATDKSFAETRERAQKLVEEEKNRGTKDMSKSRHKDVLKTASAARVGGSASSSRHNSPLLSKVADPMSRVSPNKFALSSTSSTTGNNGHQASTANGSLASRPPTQHLKSELRKKRLRQRIIHLVVTGKYRNWDQILRQLREDGLSDEQDDPRRVEDIVRDVSDVNQGGSSPRLSLKQSLYQEVDARWAWFTQEEKTLVRKITQPSNLSQNVSFAPQRRSGMERMQAPSHNTNGATVSPEVVPTPPSSRLSSGSGSSNSSVPTLTPSKKSPPSIVVPTTNSTSSNNKTKERISPVSPSTPPLVTKSDNWSSSKRKAHVPSTQLNGGLSNEKRSRQESASPPEDPSCHPPNQNQKLLAARNGGSTASSRLSSPCSLSSPTQPSCNWEKNYSEIKSGQEAEKYYGLFHTDYPDYMSCYKQLNEVAAEFRGLERDLKGAGKNMKEVSKIERQIQDRFAHFEKDPEFLKTRQRHADLRAKLSVLKNRITDWERTQDLAHHAELGAL